MDPLAVQIDRIVRKQFGPLSETEGAACKLILGASIGAEEWGLRSPDERGVAEVSCAAWRVLITTERFIWWPLGQSTRSGWWCDLTGVASPSKEARGAGQEPEIAVTPRAFLAFRATETFELETSTKDVGYLYGLTGVASWVQMQLRSRHGNLEVVGLQHAPHCPFGSTFKSAVKS